MGLLGGVFCYNYSKEAYGIVGLFIQASMLPLGQSVVLSLNGWLVELEVVVLYPP